MRFRQQPIILLAIGLIMWTNPLTAQLDFYKKLFEHRKDSLVKELGLPTIMVMKSIKAALDPLWLMNPDKIMDSPS